MNMKVKNHTFKFRVGDSEEKGGCTFIGGDWKDVTTDELFKGKKVVLFSLPGAFTPTCSGQQLPFYDEMYNKFKDKGNKFNTSTPKFGNASGMYNTIMNLNNISCYMGIVSIF